jgi:hypothetical protein
LALRYFGTSVGKGAQAAKTELEKAIVKFGENGITCREAVNELTKMYVSLNFIHSLYSYGLLLLLKLLSDYYTPLY